MNFIHFGILDWRSITNIFLSQPSGTTWIMITGTKIHESKNWRVENLYSFKLFKQTSFVKVIRKFFFNPKQKF